MGAVETLIVWENLSINRYVLKAPASDGEFFQQTFDRIFNVGVNASWFHAYLQ